MPSSTSSRSSSGSESEPLPMKTTALENVASHPNSALKLEPGSWRHDHNIEGERLQNENLNLVEESVRQRVGKKSTNNEERLFTNTPSRKRSKVYLSSPPPPPPAPIPFNIASGVSSSVAAPMLFPSLNLLANFGNMNHAVGVNYMQLLQMYELENRVLKQQLQNTNSQFPTLHSGMFPSLQMSNQQISQPQQNVHAMQFTESLGALGSPFDVKADVALLRTFGNEARSRSAIEPSGREVDVDAKFSERRGSERSGSDRLVALYQQLQQAHDSELESRRRSSVSSPGQSILVGSPESPEHPSMQELLDRNSKRTLQKRSMSFEQAKNALSRRRESSSRTSSPLRDRISPEPGDSEFRITTVDGKTMGKAETSISLEQLSEIALAQHSHSQLLRQASQTSNATVDESSQRSRSPISVTTTSTQDKFLLGPLGQGNQPPSQPSQPPPACYLCRRKGLSCVYEGRSKVCLNCRRSKKKCDRRWN